MINLPLVYANFVIFLALASSARSDFLGVSQRAKPGRAKHTEGGGMASGMASPSQQPVDIQAEKFIGSINLRRLYLLMLRFDLSNLFIDWLVSRNKLGKKWSADLKELQTRLNAAVALLPQQVKTQALNKGGLQNYL